MTALLAGSAVADYFDLGVGSYGVSYSWGCGTPLDIARHDWGYVCYGNENEDTLAGELNRYLEMNPKFKMVLRLWPVGDYVRKADGPDGKRRRVMFLDYLYYPEARGVIIGNALRQIHLVTDNVTKPENVYGLTVFEELPCHFCWGGPARIKELISTAAPGTPVDPYLADFAPFYEKETGKKMTEWNRDVRIWWGRKFVAAMSDIYRTIRADSPQLKIFTYLMTQYRPLDWLRPGEDIHSPQVIPCYWKDLVQPGVLADGFFAYNNNAVWTKRYHDLAKKNNWPFFSQLSHSGQMRLDSWESCLGYAHAKIPQNLGYFSYEPDFTYGHWNDDPDVLPEDRLELSAMYNRMRRALALRNVGMDVVRRELVPEVVVSHNLGSCGLDGFMPVFALVTNRRTDKWFPKAGEAVLRNVKVKITMPEGFVLPPEVSAPGELTIPSIEPEGVKQVIWWARRTRDIGETLPVKVEVSADGVRPVVVETSGLSAHQPSPRMTFDLRGGDKIRYVNYALPRWSGNAHTLTIESTDRLINPTICQAGGGSLLRYRGTLSRGDKLVFFSGLRGAVRAQLTRKGGKPEDVMASVEGGAFWFMRGINEFVFTDDFSDVGTYRGRVTFELAEDSAK